MKKEFLVYDGNKGKKFKIWEKVLVVTPQHPFIMAQVIKVVENKSHFVTEYFCLLLASRRVVSVNPGQICPELP